MKRRHRALEDAIIGGPLGDDEVDGLAETARTVERTFDVPAPEAARERAFFIEAVAARRRRKSLSGALAPVVAGAAVVGAFAFAARSAVPGEQIYPLRKAIAAVGLVDSTNEEINDRLERAAAFVDAAEDVRTSAPARATELAFDAIFHLERIERLLTDVGTARREQLRAEVDALKERVELVITATQAEEADARSGGDDSSGRGGGDDDSSGPGSGDFSDDDDNSGSGGGGDDDSSGPGSGDDDSGSGSGDNSGPGGGRDDNSGSGGGD